MENTENQENTQIQKESKSKKYGYLIGIGIATLLIIALGYYIVIDLSPKSIENKDTDITQDSTGKDAVGNDGGASAGGVVIGAEPLVDNPDIPHPSLTRVVSYESGMDPATQATMKGKIDDTRKKLTEDSTLFAQWLDLALLYKTVGDYKGAEEVWLYLTEASPRASISFGNLGNLYHLYLKNYPKAEEYFRKAIELSPDPQHFTGLHELYRYSYKQGSTLAVDVLEEGLAKNPGNIMLLMALGEYYRLNDKPQLAEETYVQALKIAQALGDGNLINSIEALIKSLPLK